MRMPPIQLDDEGIVNYSELYNWACDNSPTFRAINNKALAGKWRDDTYNEVMIFTLLRLAEELQDQLMINMTGYPRTDRQREEAMKAYLREAQQDATKQLKDS